MITVSCRGLNGIIDRLKAREEKFPEKTRAFAYTLAESGTKIAQNLFSDAVYQGNGSVGVRAEKKTFGAAVVASGPGVAFIEFGAGVALGNGYPGTRPPGIVGIGQYGYGRGANIEGWTYIDESGNMQQTIGNAPYAPMFNTATQLRAMLPEASRAVFE